MSRCTDTAPARRHRRSRVTLLGCAVALLPGAVLAAQGRGLDLPFQGTAAYNVIWNTPAVGSNCFTCYGVFRFSGRVAARLEPGFYAGVTVGSWEYPVGATEDPLLPNAHSIAAIATSVVMSAYGQVYPSGQSTIFLRGGAGYAANRTYYPTTNGDPHEPSYLSREAGVHLTLSAGAGVDVPLHRHAALTLSADYTGLFGTEFGWEPVAALLLGIGITIR